jgi:endonuclease/exonuclease/phosphatase family metal-dependent hydrolase
MTVRVLSWNLQWCRGADGVVSMQRVCDAIRALGEWDVLCLQEVAENFPGLKGGGAGDQPAFFAAAFPAYAAVFAPGVDVPDGMGGRSRFGNLVLSRLPLGLVLRHLLPRPADAAVPSMQRSCAEVVVETGAGPLRVMCTHLEYYSELQRSCQVDALRAIQREVADHAADAPFEEDSVFAPWPRPVSAVLCGDFNLEPGSDAYQRMLAPLGGAAPDWHDAWPLANPGRPHAPSVGLHGAEWPERRYCCDYFFVSADLAAAVRAVRVDAASAASDHQPAMLELAL